MKTGLVLEGGAMRGMFTSGILDVLMEENIQVDGIVGVSAGAAFGCNYKSGQKGRALRYNMKYCSDPRYCGIRSFLKTGDLFGADFCYKEIPQKLDLFDNEAFEASPVEFYVVCTDAETGEAAYHQCLSGEGEDLEWLRASASMPGVSRVVEVGGRKLLDGGIVDAIPLKFFESLGYDRIIVILTRPRDYLKEEIKARPLMKGLLRKYPKVYDAMKQRHHVYNQQTAYVRGKENKGEILVLRPREALPIGRITREPEKLKQVYEIGQAEAKARLDEIRRFLTKP